MNGFMESIDKYKKILLIAGTFLVITMTFYAYHLGLLTDQSKMETFLNKCGFFAPLVFVAIQAVQVVVPILPGAVGCLYGVVIFGTVYGVVLSYIGICTGSITAFILARKFGHNFVQQITGGKFFEKYSKYLFKESQFEKVFTFMIFFPVAPDDLLCYLAGISKMKLKKFTIIILLGKPAAIFLYSIGLNEVFQTVLGLIN